MANAQFDDGLRADMRRLFIDKRRNALTTLLERGVHRGEIARQADLGLLVDILYGVLWYRLLSGHAPLDDALAADLARLTLPLSAASRLGASS